MSDVPPTSGPPPTPGNVPFQTSRSIVVGDVFGTSFKIWLTNLIPFAILAVIFFAPVILWDLVAPVGQPKSLTDFSVMPLVRSIVQSVLSAALTGALVFAVFRNLTGQKAPLGEMVKVGVSRLGAVFLVSLVQGLAIAIGLILLVVPGIVVACVLAVAVPVAVVERKGLGDSFSRSAFLTKGSRWQIFGLYVIIFLVAFLVSLVLGTALRSVPTVGNVLLTILILVVSTLPWCVMQAVLYHRVRAIKEGTSVEEIAKVFA